MSLIPEINRLGASQDAPPLLRDLGLVQRHALLLVAQLQLQVACNKLINTRPDITLDSGSFF